AHARDRRGAMRPHRHHPGRQDRRARIDGRAAQEARGRRAGGPLHAAHRRRGGAGAEGRTRSMTAAVSKQPSLGHVLIPKWRTMLTRMRQERDEGGRGKAIVLGTVALIFWVAVFGVLFRVLRYFRGVEEIGALLAG